MSLTSPAFFAFILITVLAFHVHASVTYRRCVLSVANAVFIGSYVDSAVQLLPLLGFLAIGYAAMELVRRRASGVLLAAAIVGVIALYIVLKRFSFIEPIVRLPFPYLIVGLSYVLFRMVHLVVDANAGSLPGRIGPWAYFRYTCNFLCFVSGPIQRYQDFIAMDGISAVPLDRDRVYQAFSRIAAGYVKFVIIGACADYAVNNLSVRLFSDTPLGAHVLPLVYAACAVAYTAYLYFNFSGYMDIVIGVGALLGQVVPENFNRPFASRSFLEFWQRWHITLSTWFRLYLFNPLLMSLMTRFTAPRLNSFLGVTAFFVTFLVMGIWHGTTLVFVIYGLIMGAGVSANKLWQIFCSFRLGKKRYQRLCANIFYIYAARGLTIAYYVMALTCLWVTELPRFLGLVGQLGVGGILGVFILLAGGFAAMVFVFDHAGAWIFARFNRMGALTNGFTGRNLSLSARILAACVVDSLFNKSAEFVYKAF